MQAKYIQSALVCFEHIVKRYFFFHLAFIALLLILISLFASFFSFFANSFLMAVVIAFFFFSFVMYFILRLYAQEQKPRQCINLCTDYINAISRDLQTPKERAEAALSMAESLNSVAPMLYKLPRHIQFLQPYLKPFLASYYWHDVHLMKELFLIAMIDELKTNIKQHPTSPEAHKELANAWLLLSNHYLEPLKRKERFLQPSYKGRQELQAKFHHALKCAIVEFSILKEYTPKDSWVYKMLAIAYHDCQMPEKELEAYETLASLHENDPAVLKELGILYFKQGLNAKGLKMYEMLQVKDPAAAQELIGFYGAYQPHDLYTSISSL
jgi:tetratricopeptide (TPR) repeat protein